jgi:hypothetical protein
MRVAKVLAYCYVQEFLDTFWMLPWLSVVSGWEDAVKILRRARPAIIVYSPAVYAFEVSGKSGQQVM